MTLTLDTCVEHETFLRAIAPAFLRHHQHDDGPALRELWERWKDLNGLDRDWLAPEPTAECWITALQGAWARGA